VGEAGVSPVRTRTHPIPKRAAAAAVCRQWFDWSAPAVTSVRAPPASASATRNSSFRVLFPPSASPVRSSRLTRRRGPPSDWVR